MQFADDLKAAMSANSKNEERVKELTEKQRSERERCAEELGDVKRVCKNLESDVQLISGKYQVFYCFCFAAVMQILWFNALIYHLF